MLSLSLSYSWAADAGWYDRSTRPKRFGAFLSGAAAFDAAAFGVALPEAAALDPQQRLLLEGAAEALWSGLPPHTPPSPFPAPPPDVAVAVGMSYTEYYLNVASTGGLTAFSATSGTLSAACGVRLP